MSKKLAEKIKFSIIVPVYNSQEFIEKCLYSCIDQDLDCKEFEIIIINDGSTDDSYKKILKIAEKYNNIRILNQENCGISETRNKGINEAIGEYIWFVDSDDWIDKNCLKAIYQKVSHNDLDLLWIRTRRIYYDKEHDLVIYPRKKHLKKIFSGDDFLNQIFKYDCYSPAFIIRRSFLLGTGYSFVNGILYEDSEFLPRLISKAKRIKCGDIICYNYLIRPGSLVQKCNIKKIDYLLLVINSHLKFVDSCSNKKICTYFDGLITHLVIILLRLSSHPAYKLKQKEILKKLQLNKIRRLKLVTPWIISATIFNLSPVLLLSLFNILRPVSDYYKMNFKFK